MALRPPAFQFYAKDWMSSHSVSQMTMHERGIYISLLAAAWESPEPGTLPLPVESTARASGIDVRSLRCFLARWATVQIEDHGEIAERSPRDRREIAERSRRCFVEIDGKLVNEKLRQNWLNYQQISEKRRKAAECRYAANAEQMHHPASSSAPAPKNKREEEPPPTPSKGVFEVPSWVPVETWNGFVEMRRKIRAPLTEHAKELAVKKLEKLKGEGHEPGAVLDQSTLAGWRGLFPIRQDLFAGGTGNAGDQRFRKRSGAVHGDIAKYTDRKADIVVEV